MVKGARKGGDTKRSFADVRSKLARFSTSKGDRKGSGKGFRPKGKGKGKGKGKRKGPAAMDSDFWVRRREEENRNELDGVFTGTIAKYIFKQGWGHIKMDDTSALPEDVIQMLEKDKEEAREKALQKGKEPIDDLMVYFRKPDVDPDLFPIDDGEAVQFEIYTDDKGVGAHKIASAEGAAPKDPNRFERSKGKGKREDKGKGRDKGAGKNRDKGAGKGSEHLHVIELQETDASFPFRQKLLGDGAQNVKHIQETYGAKVFVGRNQPIKIDIKADTEKKLTQAVKMVEDLVGAIWDEYTQHQKDSKRKPKGGGKGGDRNDKAPARPVGGRDQGGKGGGKTDSKFNKSIKLKTLDPEFRLKSAIVGDKGSYVKHIQDECGVRVKVVDENGEMRFEIHAESHEGLRKADNMARDLIQAAYGKYDEWKAEGGAKTARPNSSSKGGSKGSSKGGSKGGSKGKRDDGPSAKRRRF